MPNASSGGVLGADFQHSNGTDSLISNVINSLISNVTNASSGGVLGADLQHSNGTDSLISSAINASSGAILGEGFHHFNGTDSLISNWTNALISSAINASSGGVLGADFQHSNGTNSLIPNGTDSLISNMTNASSGGVLGADFQHSLLAAIYIVVLLLGLAGNGLSLSLVSCRAKPLSHSYILLLHLALLDMLFLALLPLHIHSQLLGDTWSFGDTACRVTKALCCLHTSLSVAFFSCLALDAWLAALHPFTSIQLRATHYLLVATALWSVALGGIVPAVLSSSTRPRRCFGAFPESWAPLTAPGTILGFGFGVLLPLVAAALGFPLAARSAGRSGHGRARRRALGTISIVLGICALCFVPQQLGQLLQVLLETRGMPREPLPGLQRVTEVLGSCSCCLKPVLYRWHCCSRAWHCPCRLRGRPERVFTISGQRFGDPSWDCQAGQGSGKENPRGWRRLIHSRYTQS